MCYGFTTCLEHSWRTCPGRNPTFIRITIIEVSRTGRVILVVEIEALMDGDVTLLGVSGSP